MAPVVVEELSMQDLDAFLERIKAQVNTDDHVLAEKLVGSYAYLSDLVAADKTTIGELQRLLGKKNNPSEKTRDVVPSVQPRSDRHCHCRVL